MGASAGPPPTRTKKGAELINGERMARRAVTGGGKEGGQGEREREEKRERWRKRGKESFCL